MTVPLAVLAGVCVLSASALLLIIGAALEAMEANE